jgi:hypothetical protein
MHDVGTLRLDGPPQPADQLRIREWRRVRPFGIAVERLQALGHALEPVNAYAVLDLDAEAPVRPQRADGYLMSSGQESTAEVPHMALFAADRTG